MLDIRTIAAAACVALLSGFASAQTGIISVSVNNSWAINTNSGPQSASDFKYLTGPNGFLNINSFCDGGMGAGVFNRAQSNIQGQLSAGPSLGGSSAASTFAYASFLWGGAGTGTVSATGQATAAGVLPAQQRIAMDALSQTVLTFGIFGTPIAASSTATSQVMRPNQTYNPPGPGHIAYIWNRLVRTQGAVLTGTMQLVGFYWSVVHTTNAHATLKSGEGAFANTDTFATATISLF